MDRLIYCPAVVYAERGWFKAFTYNFACIFKFASLKGNKISRVIDIFESKKININLFSVRMRYDLSDALL